MFGFFFCEGPVTCFEDVEASDREKFGKWHRAMLERGVYLAPSQFEAGFMSLAHTHEDIDHTIAMAKEVFAGHCISIRPRWRAVARQLDVRVGVRDIVCEIS